jgi:hypothetical protein
MGRELRKVPPNWQHPQDSYRERHKPLHYGAGGRYERRAQEWLDEANKWAAGERPDYADESAPQFFWDWEGGPPLAEDYMLVGVPDKDCTHFMLYENTSEGTPLSPAFATVEQVAEHAAEHATTFARFKASKEDWLKILRGEPYAVKIAPGIVNIP